MAPDRPPRSPAADPAEYAHIELFRNVEFANVGHLIEQCHELLVAPGDMLLEAGAENHAVYLVVSGELEVRLVDSDAEPIVTVASGACVGELSILNRLKVSAWVAATKPTRLLVMPDDVVWSFIARSHEFASNLLGMLSGRVREDNERFLHSLDAQRRYQRAAKVDALTGLFNRRWFDEILDRQWRRACAEGEPLSVLFIDIDHFKSVNDRYGHLTGDAALREVANLLQSSIRPMDLAARFGGEEFAILMLGIALGEAREIAERLRRDIERHPVRAGGALLHLTASIGVAERLPEESADALLAACDAAMYAAKRTGRNAVAVREPAGAADAPGPAVLQDH